MIQIRKEDNQKKQKEKKLKVYKVNTHKKTVIALWVLLAMSFLFAVYKNFTAIDILILSILVDTFISKISLPMQPVPEIGSISVA